MHGFGVDFASYRPFRGLDGRRDLKADRAVVSSTTRAPVFFRPLDAADAVAVLALSFPAQRISVVPAIN
jgi:hypothetical protein